MPEKETPSRVGRPEGGSLLEKVRIEIAKPIRVNPDFVRPQIQVKEVDSTIRKFRCCMCGSVFATQNGNFLSGGGSPLWKGNGGYLPFCKSCCESILDMLIAFYSGNEEHAMRHLCSLFDWYYCDTASSMALASQRVGKSKAATYISKTGVRQVITRGSSFLDTVRDENKSNTVLMSPAHVEEVSDKEDDDGFVVTREMMSIWGKGFTKEQYQYLEREYADWIARNVCNTKSQEEIFRNIALAQLNVRIARESGGKVSDAQDALQKLMNSANVLPRQTADNLIADTQTFGTLIKKYEETSPIPEPDERWRDVDGIRRYMNTWFRGGLAKALKIGCANARLHDEAVQEMEKYTVHPPSPTDDAMTNDTSIFDVPSDGEEE